MLCILRHGNIIFYNNTKLASVKLIMFACTVSDRTKVMAKVVVVLAAILQLADALTEPDCPVMQGATLQILFIFIFFHFRLL